MSENGSLSLAEAYQLALQAKATGRMRFNITIVPPVRNSRLVRMWGECVGRVVGRHPVQDSEGGWYNATITLEMSVIDVTEAYRRKEQRMERELAGPLKVNRISPDSPVTTTR